MKRLIFGCGYLGSRVARRWQTDGDAVFVVTRSDERADALRKEGFQTIVADVTKPKTLDALPSADTVLYAVGFDRTKGHSIHEVYVEGLRHALDALPETTGRVIFISSSGVYGQNDGRWVDEDAPCQPVREGGQACLAAEQTLTAHRRGREATILRLAGLYGPGRIPRIADLREGQPLPAPSQGFLNLIHVEDAATIAVAAAAHDPGSNEPRARTYIISDGSPVLRRDYFEEAARCAGAPPPRFVDPLAGSARHERGSTSKRLKNARMLEALGVVLQYPSYREGLAHAVRHS